MLFKSKKIRELTYDEIQFFRKEIRTNLYTILYYISVKLKLKNENELSTQERFLVKTFNHDLITFERYLGRQINLQEFESEFNKINLEYLKENIKLYFKQFEISLFINYINISENIKQNDCFRFVFKPINQALGFEVLSSIHIPNSNIESEIFEQLGVTRTSPQRKGYNYDSINSIQLKKPLEIGDIIVYRQGERPDHIGFVVSKNGLILSKEGTGFVWIHPFNAFYDDFQGYGNIISFMRVKDEKFKYYFQNKFLPSIEKLKLEPDKLIDIVEEVIRKI